jgi:SAM-dependent methyltransferase
MTTHLEAEETTLSSTARMLELQNGLRLAHLLCAVAELGVADHLADGPRPVDDLAHLTGAHADTLYRVLRALASKGVFTESSPHTFGLTPLASTLRSDVPGSLRDNFRLQGSPEFQRAYAGIGHSLQTGESAFAHVNGTELFSYLTANPGLGALFNSAMGNLARQVQDAAVESYDLSGVRRLIDIGGGTGQLVAAILGRYPAMAGVVFDLPEVVPGAADVLAKAGVTDRAEAIGGDYFSAVPADGDAYVLSHVSHQLSDAEALVVLKNIREVIAPAGRVIVIDPVIPDGDVPHPGKFMDITMLALTNGRDRTKSEFASLFKAAGLRHAETVALAGASSVVVAVPS